MFVVLFQGTFRPPSKHRAPNPFPPHSEELSSSSYKGNHHSSHDKSSTFYEARSELSPTPSVNTFDVNALTDDEVRERFKSVMVSVEYFDLEEDHWECFRMIYSKGMRRKRKCWNN